MGKTRWCICVLILFLACGEKVLEPPKDLIPKEKMVDILTELTIINSAKTTNLSILQENGIAPMPYLFKKYQIDSIRFVKSDKYYASLPMEYEDIHTEVQQRIEKMTEEVVRTKKLNDSLKLVETKARRAAKKEDGQNSVPPRIISPKDSLP